MEKLCSLDQDLNLGLPAYHAHTLPSEWEKAVIYTCTRTATVTQIIQQLNSNMQYGQMDLVKWM